VAISGDDEEERGGMKKRRKGGGGGRRAAAAAAAGALGGSWGASRRTSLLSRKHSLSPGAHQNLWRFLYALEAAYASLHELR